MSIARSVAYRRATRRVLAWCAWYTKDLDAHVAAERRDEVASDLHEEAEAAHGDGRTPQAVARGAFFRAARGIPADLSWRAERIHQGEGIALGELRMHRGGQAISTMLFLMGLSLTGVGIFTLARQAQAFFDGSLRNTPASTVGVALLTLLAALGTALLLRTPTRVAGAFLLLTPAAVLLSLSADSLWFVSATTQLFAARIDALNLLVYTVSAGLVLIALSTALWWQSNRFSAGRPLVTDTKERERA